MLCTILPMFTGVMKKGSGIGPAITFLYAGPATTILAIIYTAKVLGLEIGIARPVFAVLIIYFFERDEVTERENKAWDIVKKFPDPCRRPFLVGVITFFLSALLRHKFRRLDLFRGNRRGHPLHADPP